MSTTWHHIIRYVCWSTIGALLLIAPLVPAIQPAFYRTAWPVLAIIACVGGIVMVMVRLTVGALTRYEPRAADRMTVIVLGRFLLGGILGQVMLSLFSEFSDEIARNRRLSLLFVNGWLPLAFFLTGGVALVAVYWLTHRRYARFVVPASWLAVFLLLLCACYGVHEQFPRLFMQYIPSTRII